MSSIKVQEIERSISTLTSDELEDFCAWFDLYTHPFDTRIQADLSAGRLDQAIDRALREERDGNVQPL